MTDQHAIVSLIKQFLAPLRRALTATVSRGIVTLVTDTLTMQNVQAELLADEVQDDIEHFQEYGFTSCSAPGAEVLFLAVGGNRAHGIAACVTDRTLRPTGMAPYDVCLYTNAGPRVYLDATTDTLNLGARTASDFIALATNTESRLAALERFAWTHTHLVSTAGSATAQTGTAAPQVGPSTLNVPAAPVASTKVKAV